MYRKIESGARGLSIDVLMELSEYFQTSTDYILTGKNNTTDIEKGLSEVMHTLIELQKMI